MLGIDQFLTKTPGSGGRIRQNPEDFFVEEILPYEFSGKGEHTILKVEKKLLSTFEVRDILAEHFSVKKQDIGYAGLKDKHAVTVQYFSLPKIIDPKDLSHDNIKILGQFRHQRKVKIGKLYANHFIIKIRGCDPEQAIETFEMLKKTGVPNVFGWQRFGKNKGNHLLGESIVKNKKRIRADKGKIWLFISAYQSFLYNCILNKRLKIGVEKQDGDLMKKNYGLECASAIFPGQKTPFAGGVQGEIEKMVLEKNSVKNEDFPSLGKRRAILFPLLESGYKKEGNDLILEFTIPKGCFATAALREVMKESII